MLQLSGKTENDLDESNNYGLSLINPFSALGFFYLCGYCQGEVIPNKDNLKVRQGQGSRRTSLSPSDAVDNTDANPSATQLQNTSSTPQSSNIDGAGTAVSTAQNVDDRSNTQNNSRAASPPLNNPPVCKYYKNGRCKFGVSGNNNGSCPDSHLKACKKKRQKL